MEHRPSWWLVTMSPYVQFFFAFLGKNNCFRMPYSLIAIEFCLQRQKNGNWCIKMVRKDMPMSCRFNEHICLFVHIYISNMGMANGDYRHLSLQHFIFKCIMCATLSLNHCFEQGGRDISQPTNTHHHHCPSNFLHRCWEKYIYVYIKCIWLFIITYNIMYIYIIIIIGWRVLPQRTICCVHCVLEKHFKRFWAKCWRRKKMPLLSTLWFLWSLLLLLYFYCYLCYILLRPSSSCILYIVCVCICACAFYGFYTRPQQHTRIASSPMPTYIYK